MTELENLKYEIHLAVLETIDQILVERFGAKAKATDADLPKFLPALDAQIERQMRHVYDLLPESINYTPEFIAATRSQLEQARAR